MTTELEIIRTFWPIIYTVAGAAIDFVVWLIISSGIMSLQFAVQISGW